MRRLAGLAIAAVLAAVPPASGDDALPAAREFSVTEAPSGQVVRGFALEAGGEAHAHYRIGMAVVCQPSTGEIAAHLFFGPFPAARAVQTMVWSADGGVSRFGAAAISDHGALSGFHSPILTDRAEVAAFVAAAFAPGAVIGNGHVAFRNLVPATENEEAASALLDCAGP